MLDSGVIGIEGVIVDEVAGVDADGACEVRLVSRGFLGFDELSAAGSFGLVFRWAISEGLPSG